MALARQPSPSSQAWLGGQRGLVAIPSGQFGCDHHILESLIILLWALPFPLVLVLENSPLFKEQRCYLYGYKSVCACVFAPCYKINLAKWNSKLKHYYV